MITASVVLYKTPLDEVNNVLNSFSPGPDRKLFFSDNSPQYDEALGFLKELPNVEYVYNGVNLGYGKANNNVIEAAISLGSDYHIVMNPDIRFDSAVIDALADFAGSDPQIASIMPKIVDEYGNLQHLCKLLPTPADLIVRRFFPDNGIFRKNNDRYVLSSFDYESVIDPPSLSGCFMFLCVETLKEYDIRFDERFFMYCEDFDLIRRLHRVGKTLYYPGVSIVHKQARASYTDHEMLKAHIVSACKYFNKYGWFMDKERKAMNDKILMELKLYD